MAFDKNTRVYFKKRVPMITIKPFRHMRRDYVIGDMFDRRRVKVSRRNLTRLINGGYVKLCKECDKDFLAEFGFEYDESFGRYPIKQIKPVKKEKKVAAPKKAAKKKTIKKN